MRHLFLRMVITMSEFKKHECTSHEFKIKLGSLILVSAGSNAGKSTFVVSMIQRRDSIFDGPIENLCLVYEVWQPLYLELKKTFPTVKFIQGIANLNLSDIKKDTTLIIDDCFPSCFYSETVRELALKYCHHRKITCIILSQVAYPREKYGTICTKNIGYLILLRNPIDYVSIQTWARRLCPYNSKFFTGIYRDATSRPYTALLCDLRTETPDRFRFIGGLLTAPHLFVYAPTECCDTI
jgi:hypothetical protein